MFSVVYYTEHLGNCKRKYYDMRLVTVDISYFILIEEKRGILPLFIKLLIFYSFPQHFLYFFPLPQGHGSFGLIFPSGLSVT